MTQIHIVAVAVVVTITVANANLVSAQNLSAWTQHTPAGPEVRVITTNASCPQVTFDGSITAMTVRAAPNGENYPITVCAAPIPIGAKAASIADQSLVLPVADPQRILIIGDTGCRMKGKVFQACNDPVQWPARQMGQAAAALKPDLVIHVGDYHYREKECPADNAGCAGSPVGDNWAVWNADFFEPFDELLKVAPWIPVRGNHEECDRGGQGWSRTLEGYSFDVTRGCNGTGAPFAVDLPNMALAVMDVSTAEEDQVADDQVTAYRARYASLARLATKPMWILQHRPIWSGGEANDQGISKGDNKTLGIAAMGLKPANVDVMISGHHHYFQALKYEQDLPLQIVSGHGGDNLSKVAPRNPAGLFFGAAQVKGGVDMPGAFGFAMMTKQAEGWRLTNHDRAGTVVKSCLVKGRELSCQAS